MDGGGRPGVNAPLLNQIIHAPTRLQICAYLEPLADAGTQQKACQQARDQRQSEQRLEWILHGEHRQQE